MSASSQDAAAPAAETAALAPPHVHTGGLGQLGALVEATRPRQWVKNGLVLLAPFFSRHLLAWPALLQAVLACAAFTLASSAIYLVNDVADRKADRYHPRKRLRPIASGRLSVRVALVGTAGCVALAAGLAAVAVMLGHGVNRQAAPDPFALWGGSGVLLVAALAGFVALNLAYSLWLKHLVLWDVFAIAAGFVLRAMAGGFAIAVPISPWFYLCTTFLALFLALGKRRAELLLLDDHASSHRKNLQVYSLPLLDQLLSIVVTGTLITYSLYTFQGEGAGHTLMLTIPFVLFGTFRYLYLIYAHGAGDQPDELLVRDRQILGAVVACVLVMATLLYGVPLLRYP